MSESIHFRLGPLVVSVSGQESVTRWARETFDVVRCEEPADLAFHFHDGPIDVAGPVTVGDEGVRVSDGSLWLRVRNCDMRITRTDHLQVDLSLHDRRPCWRRSLADPVRCWKMWLSHGTSLDTQQFKDFMYGVCPQLIQCGLNERGAALIHASAFAVNGRAVVLPAWGGVGKSTLVSKTVLHGSAHFLSDDHAIIDRSGQTYLHPLPAHIYAYHAESDPELGRRLWDACGPASRFWWQLATRIHRHRAVRWLAPQQLFGRAKLAHAAQIDQVIVMFRGDRDDFLYEPCAPDAAARASAAVIFNEFRDLAGLLTRADAGWAPSLLPSLGETHRMISDIYTAAFSDAGCARVIIPRRASANELVEFLRKRSRLLNEAMSESVSPLRRAA